MRGRGNLFNSIYKGCSHLLRLLDNSGKGVGRDGRWSGIVLEQLWRWRISLDSPGSIESYVRNFASMLLQLSDDIHLLLKLQPPSSATHVDNLNLRNMADHNVSIGLTIEAVLLPNVRGANPKPSSSIDVESEACKNTTLPQPPGISELTKYGYVNVHVRVCRCPH